ncbi:MAG: redox-sensitive transcriptional activator SoxR [Acidimicrobiia bacterium]
MSPLAQWLTIGELSARSGVAPSALRFYEDQGFIAAQRTAGNQRRFPRHTLRRVAVIRAGRALGLSLEDIGAALATLPEARAPTKADWARLSRSWRRVLDGRVAELEALRDNLTGCIGCGCLSLRTCAIFNPGDRARTKGTGARYLLGQEPMSSTADSPKPGRSGSITSLGV